MRFIHFIAIAVMVVAILASPLRGETWVVLAKPSMEVIGTFELAKGGVLNIDIDTRDLCIKTFEITEAPPIDLVKVITTTASQTLVEGKFVPVATVTITQDKIEAGFSAQKFRYDLLGTGFKAVSAVPIER